MSATLFYPRGEGRERSERGGDNDAHQLPPPGPSGHPPHKWEGKAAALEVLQ
jgi:hypothetical protein